MTHAAEESGKIFFGRRRATLAAAVAGLAAIVFTATTLLAQIPPEKSSVRVLPPAGDHWVYLLDPLTSFLINRVTIIDGDNLAFEGMVFGGYVANLTMSPDHKIIYMTNTYYSRGAQGTRTDVISEWDARTLKSLGEIEIPTKRLLSNPKPYTVGITPNGQYMLVSNLTPATSTTVVDLKAKKVLGEIETPGCTQALVSANNKFTALCADGSTLTIVFNNEGKATSKNRSKPFFHVDNDPVFDQPVRIGNVFYFVSYHGTVYPLDLNGGAAKAESTWPLLDSADKSKKWLPGGWELEGINPHSKQLYVLMHQGGQWSHEKQGSQIWVYNVTTHKRVGKIILPRLADSIYVTQDQHPMLFAASADSGTLQIFDATNDTYRGMIKNLGAPWLIFGP